jgi:hypothetical protein
MAESRWTFAEKICKHTGMCGMRIPTDMCNYIRMWRRCMWGGGDENSKKSTNPLMPVPKGIAHFLITPCTCTEYWYFLYQYQWKGTNHRLNMEVDGQSLFGLHVTWCAAVLIGWDPAAPPSPRITRALLVSKDRRRHLFVIPWNKSSAQCRENKNRLCI